MRFDWYSARIKAPPGRVLEGVAKLGHHLVSNDRVGRLYRHEQGVEVHHNTRGVVACVAFDHSGEDAFAWSSSDDAHEFAGLVRDTWPKDHLVTRADSCEDFIDGAAFARLRRQARTVAKHHGVSFPMVSDPLNKSAGRTQYMGAPSSEYRMRIYDKGWEMVSKALSHSKLRSVMKAGDIETITVPWLGIKCRPGDLVRTELQARPAGEEARRAAAEASPEELWTFTKWADEFAKRALALDLERFFFRKRKETKHMESLRWMCSQYANQLVLLRDDLGDWACVGKQLGDMIEEAEVARRSAMRGGS